MAYHSNRCPSEGHTRCYNGLQAFGIAAIFPAAIDRIVGREDFVTRRGRRLHYAGAEHFDIFSVQYSSYDSLTYILLLPGKQTDVTMA